MRVEKKPRPESSEISEAEKERDARRHGLTITKQLAYAVERSNYKSEHISKQDEHIARQDEEHSIDPRTELRRSEFLEKELDLSFRIIRGEAKEQRHGVEPLKEISLIFIDLDNFKQINDKINYEAGNVVLKIAADVLKDTLRGTDMLARYGGDEFVALLPNTSKDDSVVIANKLRTAVENEPELNRFGVTASLGVCGPEDALKAKDAKTLLIHATEAMRKAKNTGRNRVVIYNEEIENIGT
jgi:diguanylate cyclase (GGDEF)-like protein